MRRVIARNLAGLIGFAVIGVTAMLAVALATWSAADPSLSHATAAAVHNRLGYAGAVVADLAMQLIGLASALALLPAIATGWRMIASGTHGLTRNRIIAWAAGIFGAATALSSLSVPVGWPVPVGLGGVIGDMILKLPIAAFGSQDNGRLVGGLVFGVFGLCAFLIALRGPSPRTTTQAPVADQRHTVDDYGEDEGERTRPLDMVMAHLHHWVLIARANVMRLVSRRAATLDARGYGRPGPGRRAPAGRYDDEMDYDSSPRRVVMRGRQEPSFADANQRVRVAAPPSRTQEEDDDYDETLDGEIPSSYAPRQTSRLHEELRLQRSKERHAAYEPEEVFDEVDEPAPPAERLRADPQPTAPTAGDRRVPVGAAPKPIQQEKRPGGRMEAHGPEKHGYQLPSLSYLAEPPRLGPNQELSEEVLEGNAGILEGVLEDFGIKGEIVHVRPGPVVTLYELEPAAGVKSSRVIGLADDIARSMSAVSARVAVIPGRNVIGIELPNQRRETVYLRELLASQDFGTTKHKLAFCLGKTIGGESVIVDLARMPHLLVAGTTGSGKSVAINTMILSLLYRLTPQQCKLIMIDPKMLELSVYDGIPHLLCPVVTDPKKAVVALKWTVREMEDRYKKMSKLGVRNIDGFNARVMEANARGEVLTREVQTGFHRMTGEPIFEQEELALEPIPYIVVLVDEMADLMMVAGKEIEGAIQRLAQMARAAGIHIVMATQRPSVDVITGTIKANFPTRISFQVTSKIDSRTILAEQGAEQLLGQGDMLYMAGGGRIQRVHGPFVSDTEVEKIVGHLKKQGAPQYLDAITAGDEEEASEGDAGGLEDSADLYDKAVAVVLRDKKPSTSYVQRRLQIGYNRAASLIERMEKEGILSAPNQQGKREILVGGD
ncbi:MAG: DNA translocase FtsK [Ancalomicrobiaceae bacterium]|nr:DNA translocase FtsK [Ancalomicrobiaceae bacterium]